MNPQPLITDVNHWARVGRGMEFQFFATDAEVGKWLLTGLPDEFAPYALVGSDLIKERDGSFKETPFTLEPSDFQPFLKVSASGQRYNYWIHSKVLTPELPLRRGVEIQKLCSCNGLVLLQHGLAIKMKQGLPGALYRDASRIALVPHFHHTQSRESRSNRSYVPIYRALRKEIGKALKYSTVFTFVDGHSEEDARLRLMTEGAVTSCREGFLFTSAPGRRLETIT